MFCNDNLFRNSHYFPIFIGYLRLKNKNTQKCDKRIIKIYNVFKKNTLYERK